MIDKILHQLRKNHCNTSLQCVDWVIILSRIEISAHPSFLVRRFHSSFSKSSGIGAPSLVRFLQWFDATFSRQRHTTAIIYFRCVDFFPRLSWSPLSAHRLFVRFFAVVCYGFYQITEYYCNNIFLVRRFFSSVYLESAHRRTKFLCSD